MTPDATPRIADQAVARNRRSAWLGLLLVAIVYAIVATRHIDLPGVYMDAVNPDYLVVKILNPRHEAIEAWVLRGNYIFGNRAPILLQLYHGAQTFWLGLPLFAIFGTTVEGLRLTHAAFAATILAALHAMLLRAGPGPWLATATGVALAVDPSFSYAFRTQSYITVAPDVWLFLAIFCLLAPDEGAAARPSAKRLFWSGAWTGTAISGYFIHAFFLPALAAGVAYVVRRDEPRLRRRAWMTWSAGLAIGASPYILGYALLLRDVGGWTRLWTFVVEQQASLGAFGSTLALADRLAFAWSMIVAGVSNGWHHAMMFGEPAQVPGAGVKLALLVAAPLLLWIAAELRGTASFAQRLLVALPLAFAAASLTFGSRLGGHHFVVLVPIFYAALAVGLSRLAAGAAARRALARAGSLVPLAALVVLNVAGQSTEAQRLVATRGVGLMSDAINRLAAAANASPRKPFFFFPDWGLMMPMAFLTRGTVGMTSIDDPALGRRMLCEGHDVAIALINGDRAARRDDWTRRLAWRSPEVTPYEQGDGVTVFDVVTYRGDRDGPGCGRR